MDERSSWTRAWDWAGELRGTASFWLAGVFIGVLGLALAFLIGGEYFSLIALPLGPVVVFGVAVVTKAWVILRGNRRAFRLAVVRLAQSPPMATSPEPMGPSQAAQNRERFNAYVDDQVVKMIALHPHILDGGDLRPLQDLMAIALRTAKGIGRFDRSLETYVTDTIDEVEDMSLEEAGAERIMDAVLEAKSLYDGRDPVVQVPF
jgi:hypothetical protein